MWKAINKVMDKNENSVELSSVEVDGKCLTRERDVLEALNRHFVSVGSNLAKKIVSRPGDDCLHNIKPEQKVMKFKAVDSSFILNAIKQLKTERQLVQIKYQQQLSKTLVTLYQSHHR